MLSLSLPQQARSPPCPPGRSTPRAASRATGSAAWPSCRCACATAPASSSTASSPRPAATWATASATASPAPKGSTPSRDTRPASVSQSLICPFDSRTAPPIIAGEFDEPNVLSCQNICLSSDPKAYYLDRRNNNHVYPQTCKPLIIFDSNHV